MYRCKYRYGRCISSYSHETDRHFKVRSEEHIDISNLTIGKIKPAMESSIWEHLLEYRHFDEFYFKFLIELEKNFFSNKKSQV